LRDTVHSPASQIIFPAAAYVKMYGEELPYAEKLFNYVLLVASTIMMILGTAGSIIFDVPM
jgi:hypothetical protein